MPDNKKLPPLVEYRDISVMRGSQLALKHINLKIDLGENVAILGPNGSGKTTLIKTVTRECYPLFENAEPCLRIFGKDRWNLFQLRKLIGVVTNDLGNECIQEYLTPYSVIISNFFSGLGIWKHNRVTELMKKRTSEVMELIDITHLADRPMTEISTGEARRVVIGRALVHQPKALLLDEPTSSLDLKATYELRQTLRKVAAAGTSIIMVTHNLPDIIPEIKRVILLKEGQIFKDGPKDKFLSSKAISGLFNAPLEVMKRDGYYYLW